MGITNIPTITADPNRGIKKIENNFGTASAFWEYLGKNETIIPPIKKVSKTVAKILPVAMITGLRIYSP